MIKVRYGDTKIQGSSEEIFADLSSIASYVYAHLTQKLSKEKAQEKIMLAVERGLLIDEKIDNEIVLEMQKLTEKINGR